MKDIKAAGYVIAGHGLIHGTGDTYDAADADFRKTMRQAGILVLADDAEAPDYGPSVTRESDYKAHPATAALLALVATKGGDCSWNVADGIACTREESDEDIDVETAA